MQENNSEKEEKPQKEEIHDNQNDIENPKEESKKDNMLDNQQEETKKIFVRNIPFSTSDEQLSEFFSKYGNVVKANILKRENGASSGVGFVEFSNIEDKRNILMMNKEDLVIEGRTLDVKEARSEMDYSKTLYVGNLSFSTNGETLKKFFADFCQNLKGDFKVNIQAYPNGNSKGYAYIEFENEEDIQKALKADGEKLDERILTIEMKKSRGTGTLRGRVRGRFQRDMGRRGGFGNRRYDYGRDRDNYYRGINKGRSRSHDRSRERERSRDRYKRSGNRERGDRERDRYRYNRDRDERRDRDHEEKERERERRDRERERGDKVRGERDRNRERRNMNMDRNQE